MRRPINRCHISSKCSAPAVALWCHGNVAITPCPTRWLRWFRWPGAGEHGGEGRHTAATPAGETGCCMTRYLVWRSWYFMTLIFSDIELKSLELRLMGQLLWRFTNYIYIIIYIYHDHLWSLGWLFSVRIIQNHRNWNQDIRLTKNFRTQLWISPSISFIKFADWTLLLFRQGCDKF